MRLTLEKVMVVKMLLTFKVVERGRGGEGGKVVQFLYGGERGENGKGGDS